MNPEDEAEEDGANIDLDSQRKGKCVVLKTSTRQVSEIYHFIMFGVEIHVFIFQCMLCLLLYTHTHTHTHTL